MLQRLGTFGRHLSLENRYLPQLPIRFVRSFATDKRSSGGSRFVGMTTTEYCQTTTKRCRSIRSLMTSGTR